MNVTKEKTAPFQSAPTDMGQSTKSTTPIITDMSSIDELETRTASEIMDTFYFPRQDIIEGLLCVGTNFIVGKPKIGKSFLVLQIAYHVSRGIPIWGFPVKQGTVLYLALEDNEQRIQQRMTDMFGIRSTSNLHFATASRCINDGLEEQIRSFLQKHEDTVLIIIDTLEKARSLDKHDYASDYSVISAIKDLTDDKNLAILLVHHQRKQDAEDVLDLVSGTNGLTGSADGTYILTKKNRTDNEGTLEVVSRDLDDMRLHLIFDREHLSWELDSIEKNLYEPTPDPFLDMLEERLLDGKEFWEGTATEMLEALDLKGTMPSNVLSRKLGTCKDKLHKQYRIDVMMRRTSIVKLISLQRIREKEPVNDGNDDYDDIFNTLRRGEISSEKESNNNHGRLTLSRGNDALEKEKLGFSPRMSPANEGMTFKAGEEESYASHE